MRKAGDVLLFLCVFLLVFFSLKARVSADPGDETLDLRRKCRIDIFCFADEKDEVPVAGAVFLLQRSDNMPVARNYIVAIDEDGHGTCDLEPGSYHVQEIKSAPGFKKSAGFDIVLPFCEEGRWKYTLKIYPKYVPDIPAPTPGSSVTPTPVPGHNVGGTATKSGPVKTGDLDFSGTIAAFLISGLMLVMILRSCKRRR